MRVTSLVDEGSILKISWTQSLLHHRTHTRYIWGRKIPSLHLKSPLLSKHWRLQAVMKSDLKCSEPWIKEFLLVCVNFVKCPGVMEEHREIGKLVWSSSYTKRETGANAPTTGAFFSLASQEKCMPSALQKRCHEIIELQLDNAQCGFRPGRSTAYQIFTLQQILRNLGSVPKTFAHVLLSLRKHTTGFLVKSFGKCCGSTVLTAACYWPSIHCTCLPAQKFVSVSGELNHNRSQFVLDSDKGVCCHHSPS